MEIKKRTGSEIEKVSDKQSVDLVVDKTEKGMMARVKSALAKLFSSDAKPAVRLSEEEEAQITASIVKCSDTLRMLHDKADAQFTGPVFERIDRSGRMEEDYLAYDDVKEYMIYNCEADLDLWEAFDQYLKKLDVNSEAEKMFVNSGDFAAVINVFGGHPRICGEVFMLIFKGDLEKARAMLSCSRLPGRETALGLDIVSKLLEQDSKTIELSLDLIKQMPKKFIDSDSRADLLIEFAARHKDRAERSSSKEAAEFIVRKESETHPYR